MSIVNGFQEEFGNVLKKKNYVENKLMSVGYKYCYDQIKIPLLEYSTSFDEKIVGSSPWPEWNSKGIFNLKIYDYLNSYEEQPTIQNVLLIPEGTTSVTRWLGDKMNNNDYYFPIKMFYNLECYRNELISELTDIKKREFKQFGYEILGTDCIQSDCEILMLVFESLISLGIKKENICIRINDISIYKMLCEESGINHEESIDLKEKLDYLAECKAGKHPEKYNDTLKLIYNYLNKYNLNKEIYIKWELLLKNNSGTLDDNMYKTFGNKYYKKFKNLMLLKENFELKNENIYIDLCVIRSHEYYTGISFEVDVNYEDKHFIEIAGGGRFDRLVSNFLNDKKNIVPCTGFAFGTERVVDMLEQLNLYKNDDLVIQYDFSNCNHYNFPKDDSINSYFLLHEELKYNDKINIYIANNIIGENNDKQEKCN